MEQGGAGGRGGGGEEIQQSNVYTSLGKRVYDSPLRIAHRFTTVYHNLPTLHLDASLRNDRFYASQLMVHP